jgi:hypothetical protein
MVTMPILLHTRCCNARGWSSVRRINTVVFTRHGHRTPAKMVAVDEVNDMEMWKAMLPSAAQVASLQERFPVTNSNSGTPTDVKTHPFGCLTSKGLLKMENVGKLLKPHLVKDSTMHVRSTNFQRTQVCTQRIYSSVN